MATPDWIAVDWGTSRLRVWAMSGGSVYAKASSDQGMGTLSPDQFEPALLSLIEDWLEKYGPLPLLACGMVGAKQGWVEAPYVPVPCKPSQAKLCQAPNRDPRLFMQIAPGLSQNAPPDVMRGEETQIAGFLALNPGWDGVMCLPGTHTKWAHISAGEVVSFQSFMTGELLALLSNHSVLRLTLTDEGWADDAFATGVNDSLSRPQRLAAELFTLRADALLHGTEAAQSRARLTGLLIGAELAAARPYWLGQQVAVIGGGAQVKSYCSALRIVGLSPVEADGSAMTRAGLWAIRQHQKTKAQ
ncbi:MAG: 2-dehydro-3-deoxygalactonokinase [Mangrovicoccus sp.]